MTRHRLRGVLAAFTLMIGATASATAREAFTLETTPGGLPFWSLRRADAEEAYIRASFVDSFALSHPDRVATPFLGGALLRSGPTGIGWGEFNEQLKDVQARCGVSTSYMVAAFSLEARPDDFRAALDVCFRILSEPALREADLERLRKSVLTGRRQLENSRESIAALLMRRLNPAYGPFGRWGEPAEITKITPTDVDLWRREVFARDNMTIVAVGPFDAATFGAMIDGAFARLPAVAAPRLPAPASLYVPKTVLLEREGAQAAIVMEGPVDVGPAESPAAIVGANVLGGGLERRISKALRGELGATYGASASIGAIAPARRMISLRTALDGKLAVAGLRRLRAEYEAWRRDGATADEVAAARGAVASNYDKGGETPAGKALSLMAMLQTGRTADDEADYADRVRSLNVAAVNRVLREKMPARPTTIIVASGAEGFDADCVIHEIDEIEGCR